MQCWKQFHDLRQTEQCLSADCEWRKRSVHNAPASRLRAALATIGWSQRSLAALVDYDDRTVRRWASGTYEPPEPLLAWLEALAEFHAAHPPPVRQQSSVSTE